MCLPDWEEVIKFILCFGEVVVAAPEEHSQNSLIVSDVAHMSLAQDPGPQLLEIGVNRLLVLFKHFSAVFLKLLLTDDIDVVFYNKHSLQTEGAASLMMFYISLRFSKIQRITESYHVLVGKF